MAEKKGSVGVVRKGIVVKDQGYVPYNDGEVEKTGAWVTLFAAVRLKFVEQGSKQ